MATATTTQDDDLLIITDDNVNTDTSDTIEFSFDEEDTKTEEVKTEITSEVPVEIEESTVNSSTLEDESASEKFSFDLTGDTTDTLKEQTEEISEENTIQEETDLGFGDLSISEETSKNSSVDTSPIETTGSMNDILAKTIAELTARKDTISGDKSVKSDDIASLKKQIKELQDSVKQLEAESAMLDGESTKITANITKLESMKLDPVKDHNAKRVAKK